MSRAFRSFHVKATLFRAHAEQFTLRLVVEEEDAADRKSKIRLLKSHDWKKIVHFLEDSSTGQVLHGAAKWPEMRCVWVTAGGTNFVLHHRYFSRKRDLQP